MATFHYGATEVSGRWVVSEIDFPNGHKAQYAYANGQLFTVTFDDGTQSTLSYGSDSTSQTSTVTMHDVAAEGRHRDKTLYLTNNMLLIEADSFEAQVINQSSLSIRMATNGAAEVGYIALFSPFTVPYQPGTAVNYMVYETVCLLHGAKGRTATTSSSSKLNRVGRRGAQIRRRARSPYE